MPGETIVPTMDGKKLYRDKSELANWSNTIEQKLDKKKFSGLKSVPDKTRRILEMPEFQKLKVDFASPIWNMEKSLELKELGNKLYKEGNYAEAKDAYTKSLQYFPVNSQDPSANTEYSIIMANRSAVSSARFDFQACAQDIEAAFKYGYPKNLQFKIYHRQGHALLKLKQFADSKEKFNKCLDMIGKSDLPSKQRDQFRMKTKKQMTVFNVTKTINNQEMPKSPELALNGSPQKLNPEFSEKIDLNEKNEVVITKNVNMGDVLIKEEPFVKVLDGEHFGKICPLTFEQLKAPVPCSFGSWTQFSSEEARELANQTFQKYEWMFLEKLLKLGLSPISTLALRLITSSTSLQQLEEKLSAYHQEQGSSISLAVVSALLFDVLKRAGFLADKANALTEDKLMSLIHSSLTTSLNHALKITSLSLSESRERAFEFSKFPTKFLGHGFFPNIAKISTKDAKTNETNSFCYFQNQKLIVHSQRDLTVGAKLYFNLNDDESNEEVINEMITFRCSNENCTVGFPLKENTKEKLIKCPMEKCQKETNIWLKLKRIQELKQLCKKNMEETIKKQGNLKEGLKGIKHLIREWEKIVIRPYRDISQLEKDLKFCILLENVEEHHKWLKGM